MRSVHPWLLVKVVLFLLVIPGTVLLYVPGIILYRSGIPGVPDLSPVAALSILAGVAGLSVLLVCVRDFAVHGHGTPAPFDPPSVLVVRRLYRYTRNPMYLGVTTVLIAESALFGSLPLLMYSLVVFLGFHLFVVFKEETYLLNKFGSEYERYRRAIPRWGISLRPFQ
jgi:protein-S-isoprenylcysteine O-methyltransferase Ste14